MQLLVFLKLGEKGNGDFRKKKREERKKKAALYVPDIVTIATI